MNKANNKERELSCISVGELEGFELLSSQLPAHKSKKGSPHLCRTTKPQRTSQGSSLCQGSPWCCQAQGTRGEQQAGSAVTCFTVLLPRRPNQAWTLKQALASDLFLSIIQVVCSDPNLRCRTFHCTAFFLLSWLTHLGLAEMLRILQSPCIYHGFSETKILFCRMLAKKSYSGSKGNANVMNRRRGWILHFQA